MLLTLLIIVHDLAASALAWRWPTGCASISRSRPSSSMGLLATLIFVVPLQGAIAWVWACIAGFGVLPACRI